MLSFPHIIQRNAWAPWFSVAFSKVLNEYWARMNEDNWESSGWGSLWILGPGEPALGQAKILFPYSVLFCSVTKSCLTLLNPMNYSTPGFPVLHYLPELTQTQVHWVGDAIQPSHPLSYPSPLVLNLSQHQGLFQWVSSSQKVAKVLELQLQHQSFQWIFKTDFL